MSGRSRSDDGFGALGPLGNASSIDPGAYKITGSGVNVRSSALTATGNTLNIGDDFTADGTVKGTEVNGVYTNFASGTSKAGPGFVAIEYLAPASSFQAASYQPQGGGGGPAPIIPASRTTTTTQTITETTWTDYIPYVIGALAVVGIGYALFGTKKGQAVRRLARHRVRKYGGTHRRR
jgi:hypothetical protein